MPCLLFEMSSVKTTKKVQSLPVCFGYWSKNLIHHALISDITFELLKRGAAYDSLADLLQDTLRNADL